MFNLKSLGRERLWHFSGGQHGHGIQPFAQGSAGAQNFLGAMPFFGWQEMAWLGQVGCKLGMKSRHLFYKSARSVYLAGSCIFSHVRSLTCLANVAFFEDLMRWCLDHTADIIGMPQRRSWTARWLEAGAERLWAWGVFVVLGSECIRYLSVYVSINPCIYLLYCY